MPSRSLARRRPSEPPALPGHDPRLALFEKAGLTPERQATLLKSAVEALEGGLLAMSAQYPGQPDHFARMKAAGQLIGLVGAEPSRASVRDGGGKAEVTIVIPTPDWAAPVTRGTARDTQPPAVIDVETR